MFDVEIREPNENARNETVGALFLENRKLPWIFSVGKSGKTDDARPINELLFYLVKHPWEREGALSQI